MQLWVSLRAKYILWGWLWSFIHLVKSSFVWASMSPQGLDCKWFRLIIVTPFLSSMIDSWVCMVPSSGQWAQMDIQGKISLHWWRYYGSRGSSFWLLLFIPLDTVVWALDVYKAMSPSTKAHMLRNVEWKGKECWVLGGMVGVPACFRIAIK